MAESLNILLVEPYFTGSHKAWAQGLKTSSSHNIHLLTMPGNYWKWRMHGGAVTLARKFMETNFSPDLILATDMLDLSTFLSLARTKCHFVPVALYFHENQLTYPWSPADRDVQHKRDNHYSFINYSSAITANKVLFNSAFHRTTFLQELKKFLKGFPDNNELETVMQIEKKSTVLPLGMNLEKFDDVPVNKHSSQLPTLLWNHRWEYDKNPEDFFKLVFALNDEGMDFELVLLGENFSQQPAVFNEARKKLGNKLVQFGYVESFNEYASWLKKADILPVTSNQDFFGGSVVEAAYCNCFPILPNRLAYPEHFTEEQRQLFFYNDFTELVEKTKHAIRNIVKVRKVGLKQQMSKYNWANLIHQYDGMFEEMAKNSKN